MSQRLNKPARVLLEPERRFESAAELREFLRAQRLPVVRVGCDLQHIVDWLLVRIRTADVLLCLQQAEPRPEAVEVSPKTPVLIGANSAIYMVDTEQQRVAVAVQADTTFYEFVDVSESGVTGLFEAAIVQFAPNGELLWRRETDLVSDYRCEDGRLRVDYFDGAHATFDLSSGDLID
jgi:hypothetical protein